MRLPNFFIIGAPKAGTTALWHAMATHPQVYMSPVKEPMYFACDGEPPALPGPAGLYLQRHAVWRPLDYLRLFEAAGDRPVVGEASPLYLRAPGAPERLARSVPDARLVVILRQPVERAYSHYVFMRQHGAEPAPTFAEAIRQEDAGERREWFSGLQHLSTSLYAPGLQRYLDRFGSERVRIYLYEDWRDEPAAFLDDLCRFLGIAPFVSIPRERSNVTRGVRSERLQRLALQMARGAGPLAGVLRRLEMRYNRTLAVPLPAHVRAELTPRFHADIKAVERLCGRSLAHWLQP